MKTKTCEKLKKITIGSEYAGPFGENKNLISFGEAYVSGILVLFVYSVIGMVGIETSTGPGLTTACGLRRAKVGFDSLPIFSIS